MQIQGHPRPIDPCSGVPGGSDIILTPLEKLTDHTKANRFLAIRFCEKWFFALYSSPLRSGLGPVQPGGVEAGSGMKKEMP